MKLFAKGKGGPGAPTATQPQVQPIDRVGLLGLLDQVVNGGGSGTLQLTEPRGSWTYAFQNGALTHASGGRVRGARQAFDLLWEFQSGQFLFLPGPNPELHSNLYIDKGRLLELLRRSQTVLQGPASPYIPPDQQRPVAPVNPPFNPQPGMAPAGWQAPPQVQGYPPQPYSAPPAPQAYPPAYPNVPYQPAPGSGMQPPRMPAGMPQQQPMMQPLYPGQQPPLMQPPYPGQQPPLMQPPYPGQQPPMILPSMPQQPVPPQPMPQQPIQQQPAGPYPMPQTPGQPAFMSPRAAPPAQMPPARPAAPARPVTPPSFSVPPMPIPKRKDATPVYQPPAAAAPAPPAPSAAEPKAPQPEDDLRSLRASLVSQAPIPGVPPAAPAWGVRKSDGTVMAPPASGKVKSNGKQKKRGRLAEGIRVRLIKFLLWACERKYSPDDHWTLKDAFEVSTMELRDQFVGAFSQSFKTNRQASTEDDDVDQVNEGRMRGRARSRKR
jgi:hypothetical protein